MNTEVEDFYPEQPLTEEGCRELGIEAIQRKPRKWLLLWEEMDEETGCEVRVTGTVGSLDFIDSPEGMCARMTFLHERVADNERRAQAILGEVTE